MFLFRSHHPILNLRLRSLARGNVMVIGSLFASVLMSDFPHNRATMLLVFPTLLAMVGTGETVRCMRLRWGYYHAGVILCIYMDLMILCMILFFLIYPYWHFLSVSR